MKTDKEIAKIILEEFDSHKVIKILSCEIVERNKEIKRLLSVIEDLDKRAWKPGDH